MKQMNIINIIKLYNQYGSTEQPLANELAIKNMIEACKLDGVLSKEEKKYIKEATRIHVLMKSLKVKHKLEKYFNEEVSEKAL